jgi:hypothetical protein
MSQLSINAVYAAALKAQIVSLEARVEALSGYIYNDKFQLEARIVLKQIEALQNELADLGTSL